MYIFLHMSFQTITLTQTPEHARRSRNLIVNSIDAKLWDNINDLSSIKMLDVWCGEGNLIRHARSIGVDAHGIDVNIFHNNQDLPIVKWYISDMPFADNTFNLVHAYGVFDPRLYPQDLPKTFAEIARVMQSKGILSILDMDMPAGEIIHNAWFELFYKVHGGNILFQKK